MKIKYSKYKSIILNLKKVLSDEKYRHSLGTAQCARNLAIKFGEDLEQAYLAGLLHDCAKCFSVEKLEEILDKMGVDRTKLLSPKTYHAPASAYVAETEYGIRDKKILKAIEVHTVGRLNMTNFDKIIFLADKIESVTRIEPYFEPIRTSLKNEGLDSALLECYTMTLKSLVDRRLKISPLTVDIYNELIH